MSVYATTFALDDDPHGPAWEYQGSHLIPTDDGPRGATVQLAEIPSHITRDGRDDAPEDSRPWPWARLSAGTGDAVISPGQARALATALTAWADDADPQGHVYLSTGCLHGDLVLPDGRTGHAYCQGDTGHAGSKVPARCKFCAAPCVCPCHREAS